MIFQFKGQIHIYLEPHQDIQEDEQLSECIEEFKTSRGCVNRLYESRNLKKPRNVKWRMSKMPIGDEQSLPSSKFLTESDSTKKELSLNQNIAPKFFRDCGWASILIVDDSPFNLLILREIFKKIIVSSEESEMTEKSPTIHIDEATNGLKALNMVKDTMGKKWWRGYESVLMDLSMPIMDGATSASKITKLQKEGLVQKDLKVIPLTAYDSPEYKELWKAAGMTGFLNKPVCQKAITNVLTC